MISAERKAELLRLWKNERTAEDEEYRDELTQDEAALVDEWDNQYSSGTAALAADIQKKAAIRDKG